MERWKLIDDFAATPRPLISRLLVESYFGLKREKGGKGLARAVGGFTGVEFTPVPRH